MNHAKERPILFSAPMVRAILLGQKTVTRRPIRFPFIDKEFGCELAGNEIGLDEIRSNCPYGVPGQRLWVREAWKADAQVNAIAPRELSHGEPIQYPADGASRQNGCSMITPGKTRPSIHMPRWVSRILLEITDVRVERLQDISEEQATAEGVGVDKISSYRSACVDRPAGFAFRDLWTGINGSDSWEANPWVWAITFRRVEQ
ncbi:hypothetical protein AO073_14530 [Pseudomonas syringae ICMP 11293]|uniref:hypothetical protein n=1 Tax=Pseudomonas syringae TaxID=317 RepID=UPI0007319094|nr:hypothetical protein [Pseudomonas syringae]KTB95072.1 hypothetical protein AO073_14530 [Pseudomonas syringae ICMP 11293]